MPTIINIETSGTVCSVAVSQDGACIYKDEHREGPEHARVLAPMVEDAVSFADSHAIPIDAVAVSKGPGSYTGLRIGVSTAKGLCYGRHLPLIGIPTLKVLCVPLLLSDYLPDDALLCPMVDARRMEVYCCVFDRALREVSPTEARIIDADSFKEYLDKRPVFFIGSGAGKVQDVVTHRNAHFVTDAEPLAEHMFPLAEQALARHQIEDTAYFEPFYLKEFVATKAKNPLL